MNSLLNRSTRSKRGFQSEWLISGAYSTSRGMCFQLSRLSCLLALRIVYNPINWLCPFLAMHNWSESISSKPSLKSGTFFAPWTCWFFFNSLSPVYTMSDIKIFVDSHFTYIHVYVCKHSVCPCKYVAYIYKSI